MVSNKKLGFANLLVKQVLISYLILLECSVSLLLLH